MRIQAYIRICSSESTIRAIHKETNIPRSSIKELKAKRGAADTEMWWNWETARTSIDPDNPDDGFKELLAKHKAIFPIIKKYQGPETGIYLEIITKYEKNEEPRGLYISAETIALLSELGGALDNDVWRPG